VRFSPGYKNLAASLEGIEQLVNLKKLYIVGWEFDMIDYSPVKGLQYLETITLISGDTDRESDRLTKVPDFSDWASRLNITDISFRSCALTSLDNLEYLPNLRRIVVVTDGSKLSDVKALKGMQELEELIIVSEGGVFRIEEISPLPKLKILNISGTVVDAKGAEGLSALERMFIDGTDLVNASYLSGLSSVIELIFTIRDAELDISFIGSMPSLERLTIYADDGTWGSEYQPSYQILDLSPLGNLPKLRFLELRGFILKNVAALDRIETSLETNLYQSSLYSGSEKSRHHLEFAFDTR
jgi:hypothetical protein